jgi:large subunit ribosomal protein L23
MDAYEILRRPIVTEKSNLQSEKLRRYTFEVSTAANKLQIKGAVETIFKVKVLAVNVRHVRGKQRRMGRIQGHTKDWKKATVTLAEGQTIQFFEGV